MCAHFCLRVVNGFGPPASTERRLTLKRHCAKDYIDSPAAALTAPSDVHSAQRTIRLQDRRRYTAWLIRVHIV